MLNRQSGVKTFLSAITAPILLAHQHPANLIRQSYSRYEYICANILALLCYSANTIGVVNVYILNRQCRSKRKLVLSYWPKFAALRLFVETMPIYKAVATGNGKNEF
jgi:hypothetical protein